MSTGIRIKCFSQQETQYELEALLEQVTADNRHGETGTGDVVGNEVWYMGGPGRTPCALRIQCVLTHFTRVWGCADA